MRYLALILLLLAIPALAAAQDVDESEYVDYYFGTQVVLTMPSAVTDRTRTYWGDLLPQEFAYDQASLVEVINDSRGSDADKLQLQDYPVTLGADKQLDDGSWEYYIEFRDCTPSEAQLVLDEFGLGDEFANADVSFRPVKVAYFYGYEESGGMIAINLPGGMVEFDPAETIEQCFDNIDSVLAQTYGENYKVEVYVSAGRQVFGPDYTSLNVTIYLDGAEQDLGYEYYDY